MRILEILLLIIINNFIMEFIKLPNKQLDIRIKKWNYFSRIIIYKNLKFLSILDEAVVQSLNGNNFSFVVWTT